MHGLNKLVDRNTSFCETHGMPPVQECAYGPTDLQKAPAWLSTSIGPVDAGERAVTESVQPQDLSDGACEGDCSDSAVSQTSPAAAPAQPTSG